MTDKKENRKHLYYLHELSDFKVDSDDPDVRGWKVKDVDNRVVGKVDNLLVSKEKKRVVYLDVEVDKSIIDANHDPYGKPAASGDVHEFINKDGENHLILPIGLARLNLDDKYVYTDKIDHQTFAETKRMEKGYDVDRDYEIVVLESYNRDIDDDDYRRSGQEEGYRAGVAGDQSRTRTGTSDSYDERRESLSDHERVAEDRDRNRTDRDKDLTDRDRDLRDSDTRSTRRNSDSGTFDERRDRDRLSDDDSFYDRGEFDRTRYRNNR